MIARCCDGVTDWVISGIDLYSGCLGGVRTRSELQPDRSKTASRDKLSLNTLTPSNGIKVTENAWNINHTDNPIRIYLQNQCMQPFVFLPTCARKWKESRLRFIEYRLQIQRRCKTCWHSSPESVPYAAYFCLLAFFCWR